MREEVDLDLEECSQILETQEEMICKYRPDATLTFVNRAYCEMVGRSREELLNRKLFDIFPEENHDIIRKNIDELGGSNEKNSYVHPRETADGRIRYHQWKQYALFDEEGELAEILAVGRDITEKMEARDKLEETLEYKNSILEIIPDIIIRYDREGTYLDIITSQEEKLISPREDLLGSRIEDVFPEEEGNKFKNKIQETLNSGEIRTLEYCISTPAGIKWFEARITSLNNEEVISLIIDITDRKNREKQLKYKTFHDELTGLNNRTHLAQKIDKIDTASNLPISLIMIDINGLKIVNDTFGHKKGDEMLKKTAGILESVTGDEDVLVRYGGDEFLIFLLQTKKETAHDIYERIKNRCQKIRKDDFPLSLGIGIATKTDPEEVMKNVIKRADDSMLQDKLVNKKSRKNRLVKGLLDTLGAKSDETRAHAARMKKMAHELGEKVGVSNSELNRLTLLATLHDIGKTSVPEEILTKPGDLTEKEWEQIKKHPEKGYKIASATDEFAVIAEEVLSHHERWDGGGYPRRLAGEEIPFLARIISIVDAYDVMTSGRPYKDPMSKEEALKEIKENAGSQFDPRLAERFVKLTA